jgi:hypothetical protein
VLGYNLPPSFDTLAAVAKENEEAKSMIELGYFHYYNSGAWLSNISCALRHVEKDSDW